MNAFIYNYEAAILSYINGCFPQIKLATYARQDELFNAMNNIKLFPAFYYNRDVTSWELNRKLDIIDAGKKYSFVQFKQEYKGYLLVENTDFQFDAATKLRFYWKDCCKVKVAWPIEDNYIDVQLRLLYIKLDEIRRPDDKKGACRVVEFSWYSQLFVDNIESYSGLVKCVKIYIDPSQEGVLIGEDSEGNKFILNKLLKTLK